MHQLKVYFQASEDEMRTVGCKLIPTRWIDINKGDSQNELIRSRLVAQETHGRSTLAPTDVANTFAATPPLEAIKLLISLMMSQAGATSKGMKVLGFYDISRAHFHSDVRRPIYGVGQLISVIISISLWDLRRGPQDSPCGVLLGSSSPIFFGASAILSSDFFFHPALQFSPQLFLHFTSSRD